MKGAALAVLVFAQTASASSIVGRVVDAEGAAVPEAIVFIEGPGKKANNARATMDQIDKAFVPGVLPVTIGTQVNFPNRDQIRHHVYSFSRAKRFELPLYKGEEAAPVVFDKAGVVKIGCNIHDWMSAIILVLPNERYAVTGPDGRFALEGLEQGEHAVAAWHAQSREKTEQAMQRVQLGASGVELEFRLTLAPARARPATRGARWE
jgi:plastocyanin